MHKQEVTVPPESIGLNAQAKLRPGPEVAAEKLASVKLR